MKRKKLTKQDLIDFENGLDRFDYDLSPYLDYYKKDNFIKKIIDKLIKK